MTRSTIELKPTKDTVEQVFLSPRVLDRTAFEEFAGALKGLIERAGEDTRTLMAAASQADAVYSRLSQVSPNIEAKTAEVERAVRSIMNVRDEAFTLLSRAEACVQRISDAEAHIEAAVDERLAAFGNRLQAALGQAEQRVAQSVAAAIEKAHLDLGVVEARLNDSELRMKELSSDSAGLGSVCDRATALLGREATDPASAPSRGSLAEAIMIAERTIAELHATSDQVAGRRDAAEDTRRELARAILDAAALCDDLRRNEDSLRRPASDVQPADAAPAEPVTDAPEPLPAGRSEEFRGWFRLSQEIEAKPARQRKRSASRSKGAKSSRKS